MATLTVLSVLSTVPGIIAGFAVKSKLEKDLYYEFLRAVSMVATCVVLSGCSAIPIMLGFLVEETLPSNNFESEFSLHSNEETREPQ